MWWLGGWLPTWWVYVCIYICVCVYNKHVACAHCNVLALSHFSIRIEYSNRNPATLHNETWLHAKGILQYIEL